MRERAVDDAMERGRTAWPGVVLDRAVFERAVARHSAMLDGTLEAWLEHRGTDLFLATAAAQGDATALALLDARFFASLGATVRSIDTSAAFLDEVRQELRVYLLVPRPDAPPRIADFAARGSLSSWLHVTAARTAISLKRRARAAPADWPEALPAVSPEVAYLRERYRDDLEEAFRESVRELTSRERNILRMHFLDGVPLDRIAAMYGTHRTTLGRWVAQACDDIVARTKKRLGARVNLPAGAMDSIVDLLRSEVDFSASLLMTTDR
jgi:RNA polymerase sigma-70 factor, ECF subfamily